MQQRGALGEPSAERWKRTSACVKNNTPASAGSAKVLSHAARESSGRGEREGLLSPPAPCRSRWRRVRGLREGAGEASCHPLRDARRGRALLGAKELVLKHCPLPCLGSPTPALA